MEWTTGMVEWWNGGTENFKVYFQILHPNKGHIPISQHINTCLCLMK